MRISEILVPKRTLCDVSTGSKKAALEIVSNLIASADSSLIQTEVFSSLISREKLGSTGLGNGIALPHGRLKYCQNTLGAFVRLQTGVDYDAIDQKPVDLLFALLVPKKSTQEHLNILANLAKMFSNNESVEELRRVQSRDEVFSLLVS